jgi:hypothetical protein
MKRSHAGHYRVALAVNSPTDLPLDPKTETKDTGRGPWSVSAEIQKPPQIPVLAGGLFAHSTPPTGPMPPWEADVRLPNINGRKCTLQVVQFNGRPRLQQSRWILLPPRRGVADNGRSVEANR